MARATRFSSILAFDGVLLVVLASTNQRLGNLGVTIAAVLLGISVVSAAAGLWPRAVGLPPVIGDRVPWGAVGHDPDQAVLDAIEVDLQDAGKDGYRILLYQLNEARAVNATSAIWSGRLVVAAIAFFTFAAAVIAIGIIVAAPSQTSSPPRVCLVCPYPTASNAPPSLAPTGAATPGPK